VTHIYAPNSADINSHQIGNGPTDTPIGSTDWSAFVPIGANGTAGPFGASTTFAQLLAAPGFDQTEAGLQPALPITTFHTGNGAGVLIGMTATLNNVPWFFQSTIEVVVWDNSSGLYPTWTTASAAWESGLIAAGNSGPLNVQLYGPSPPPASLIGLQSFNLYYNIPEPSSLALGTLGLISVGMFSRLASLKVPPKRLKDSNLRKG
jgi:hypothetical protein